MSGLQTRRLWLNLLLLLLVGGLGGLAWWFVNKPQQGAETLYSGDLSEINLITLERSAQADEAGKVRFELRDGYWWMVKPREIMANGVRLRQLFTFLNEEVAASYDSAGKDLAQYDLQPAQVKLRFNDQQYVLGADNAVSNNRYVLHNNKIKLVSESVYGSVQSDWVNFVSLRLLPEGKAVKSVQLPERYARPNELTSSWQNADAIRLESVNGALKESVEKVLITLSDGEQIVFYVDKKNNEENDELELIQPERGIRYVIPATQADYLFPLE